MTTKTRLELIIEALDQLNIIVPGQAPSSTIINKMDEVFDDPQTQHLGIAVPVHHPELGDIRVVGQPVGLSRTPSEIRSATPARGADTEALMREFGYSSEQIADLQNRLII